MRVLTSGPRRRRRQVCSTPRRRTCSAQELSDHDRGGGHGRCARARGLLQLQQVVVRRRRSGRRRFQLGRRRRRQCTRSASRARSPATTRSSASTSTTRSYLAVDQANQNNTFGFKVTLVKSDDVGDPSKAPAAATTLAAGPGHPRRDRPALLRRDQGRRRVLRRGPPRADQRIGDQPDAHQPRLQVVPPGRARRTRSKARRPPTGWPRRPSPSSSSMT